MRAGPVRHPRGHALTRLTHTDAAGRAHMVDVGPKPETERVAVAEAVVTLAEATLRLIRENGLAKGDVLAVARVAGVMGAKQTAALIPLCHPLPLTQVGVDFELEDGPPPRIRITATARTVGRTGVEMEALTAASVAALTIYDMAKAVDRGMTFSVRLLAKSGGKSGDWRRDPGA